MTVYTNCDIVKWSLLVRAFIKKMRLYRRRNSGYFTWWMLCFANRKTMHLQYSASIVDISKEHKHLIIWILFVRKSWHDFHNQVKLRTEQQNIIGLLYSHQPLKYELKIQGNVNDNLIFSL